jgi:hypothetical protein
MVFLSSSDIQREHLLPFLTLVDIWTLRFLNHDAHQEYNNEFFRAFKKRFEQRLAEVHLPRGFSFSNVTPRGRFTGSFIWSILLDTKWKYQDVDFFCESIPEFNELRLTEPGWGFVVNDSTTVDDAVTIPTRHKQMISKCIGIPLDQIEYTDDTYWCIQKYPGCKWISIGYYVEHRKSVELVYHNQPLGHTLSGFDIVGCACSYDGGVLVIPQPTMTLFRTSLIRDYEKENSYEFHRRKEKYEKRGITLLVEKTYRMYQSLSCYGYPLWG